MKKQPGWALPSLKEAQVRTHKQSQIEKGLFEIPTEAKLLGQGKRYYLRTYGCQANQRDSETLAGIMEALCFTPCEDAEQADVILLNTCAIRKNAEDKVLGELGQLKRMKKENPDLVIGICGCMSQEEAIIDTLLTHYRHVELIFGTHNLHRLPILLYQVMTTHKKVIEVYSKEGEVIENLPVIRFDSHKAWVNIMYGCDKFCTYCIVPYTRGKERSRMMEDILEEVRTLKAQGFHEITLLGQNVNAYGKDLGLAGGFAKLLAEVAQIGIARVRFMTSHPWDFTDEMIDVIARYDNIMPFIHLPVQSGDSDILKLMGRRYTIEEYKKLYDKITSNIKNCAFSTDIIVGFPNESEAQFQHTLDIVDYCKFDNAFTFIYSPREGTPAAKMADNVPLAVKQERLQRLNEKTNYYTHLQNEKYRGKIVTVLVDGFSKKNDQVYSGHTDTNKLVNFIGKDVKAGDFVEVEITDVKTWSLDGKQV